MHLQRVKINDFRNLKDFEIEFTEGVDDPNVEGGRRNFNSHAIIGANGAGKSNLLEAIITIFRDLDLNLPASLDYELDYRIGEHRIQIKAERGAEPAVMIDGTPDVTQRLRNEARALLPSNIFVYYSGKNERIEKLFEVHEERFNAFMQSNGQASNDLSDSSVNLEKGLLRRLFYCRSGHSQLVLLACLLSNDEAFKQLLKDLKILDLDSALFVLKQPHRLHRELQEDDITQGDNRFWYARGHVVDDFLDKLWELAVAPIAHTEDKLIDFRGRKEKQDQLYLFLPDKLSLQKLGDKVGEAERFFRYAEAAYIGDLIDEVRINVKHQDAEGNIGFSQLSEGELQLLTVLGLMRITSQDHCLFLLDEPDTHLNPIWKLRYFDEIEKVIRKNLEQTVAGDSHIIITTHDPMMIGSLRREQVRILRRERGESKVETPDDHPQGMGVAGLLKSEMFGLPSTLDGPTLRELEDRNKLLAKKAKEGLTEIEEAELVRLRGRLDNLGFSREYRDPMYQLFIEKMYEVRSQPLTKLLTDKELQEQETLAKEVATELVKRERVDELSDLAKELKLKLGD